MNTPLQEARRRATAVKPAATGWARLGSWSQATGRSASNPERRANLHEAAYERLRRALMDGHFKPGQTFTIRALAEVFGTSPMPVRDALKRLVSERALDLTSNRSVVLPVMTRARFREILQIRLSIEPMITQRAAIRITPETIEAMAADHQQMCRAEAAGQAGRYLAANCRFHFRLYESADAPVMLAVIQSMWLQIGPHLNHIFRLQRRASATARVDHHHNDLLRALRRQDAEAAAKAVWNDLSDAADSILAADKFES
jgi:DNA-binding GntR family transcriptional regulator